MHKRTHVRRLAREVGRVELHRLSYMGIRCLRWQTGTPRVRLRPATMVISLPLFFLNFFACFLFFNHVSPLFRFLFHFPQWQWTMTLRRIFDTLVFDKLRQTSHVWTNFAAPRKSGSGQNKLKKNNTIFIRIITP